MENTENNATSFIKNCIGKEVLVKLSNDEKYKGTLITIDGAFNVYLINAQILKPDSNKSLLINNYKHLFIRGNNILFITPFVN